VSRIYNYEDKILQKTSKIPYCKMAELISEAAFSSENEPTKISAEVSSIEVDSKSDNYLFDSMFVLCEGNDDESWILFGVGGPA
jgi:hypothetical protein